MSEVCEVVNSGVCFVMIRTEVLSSGGDCSTEWNVCEMEIRVSVRCFVMGCVCVYTCVQVMGVGPALE